jgi:hypothetical protein
MKKWLCIAGTIAILIVGGYFLLSFYAVKFIQAHIQKTIGPGFSIDQVKVKTTHLSIQNIRFEDPETRQKYFQIEEIKIYPDLLSFLKRRIGIRKCLVLKPSFSFYRTRKGAIMGPWLPTPKEEKREDISSEKQEKKEEPTQLRIDRFQVQKGSVDFDDMKAGETPGQFRLRDVDLEIRNIEFPLPSTPSPIELRGKIKGKTKEGEIFTKGWVNLKTQDLETSFKMREVELKIFEPYYRKKVSAEIESGHLNMDATLTVKNRKIDAPGQMEWVDLHIGEKGTVFYLPSETLASLLKKKGNRIKFQFHLKGNMDDPRFSLQEAFLTQMAISMTEALGLPIKRKGGGGMEEGLGLVEELLKKKEKRR